MKPFNAALVLGAILLLLPACTSLEPTAKLSTADTRALNQFEQIRNLVRDMVGSIPVTSGQQIIWEETEQYRVYRTTGYSIIQVNKTFDPNNFQIIFLDGYMENMADYQPIVTEKEPLANTYSPLQQLSAKSTREAPAVMRIKIGEHKSKSVAFDEIRNNQPEIYQKILLEDWSKVRAKLTSQEQVNNTRHNIVKADAFIIFAPDGTLISLRIQSPSFSNKVEMPHSASGSFKIP